MPLLPIDDARRRVLEAIRPLPAETVAITDALDRVLAQDVQATDDVPPFAGSAMDGYAIHAGPANRRLRVVGESRAGAPATRAVADDEAIRISTGAAVPAGATAVVPQEQTERDGEMVTTTVDSPPGAHIRGSGEDMRAGAAVLDAGTRLGPIELGAAIAAGAGRLAVARRPRLAVLATGDELRPPGAPLALGEIHNSNATMLAALGTRCGARCEQILQLADERAATIAGIRAAIDHADAVVLSGGVSVGPHDHVKDALATLGVREILWGVALQPGKPTWFGVAPDGTPVFGLPGNPVSAVVTFSLFVAPALAALQCAPALRPPHPAATLDVPMRRNPQRDQAARVSIRPAPNGRLLARPTGAQGSHVLSSLLDADALAIIPAGDGELPAGAIVSLAPLVR